MNWAQPLWLMLTVGVAVLAVGVALGRWSHRRRLAAVFSERLLVQVLPRSVRARRRLRDVCGLLGLAAMVVALAEPRFDKQLTTVRARGTDVAVLLDLSRSMDAADVDPSRLERARRELADLGTLLEGDRVGLVLYAGGAFARLPLTDDFAAITDVVAEAGTDTFRTQGSALGPAITVGLDMLNQGQDAAGKAMIVLSDGETHDREEALAAADVAADQGVRVYVVGIGIEAAPIPTSGGALQHNGTTVMTTPDFEILEQVAERTRGAFVQSNASSADIEGVYRQLRRNVVAIERDAKQRETWRSAYQWPLGLALGLWLFASWLGDGRRPWGAATLGALALASATSMLPGTASAADPLFEADQLFREGRFEQAARDLTELSLVSPDDPEVFDRLGAARYRAEDYEGAARAWEWANQLGSPESDRLFNTGNAYYRTGRLEDAQARYEGALEAEPGHGGAATNRDLVVREMALRREQKPPPPPKPGEGEQEEQEGGEGEQGEDPQQGESQDESSQGGGEGEAEEAEGPPEESDGEPAQGAGDGEGQPEGGAPSDASPEDEGTSEAVDPSQVDDASADGDDPDAAGAPGGGPGAEGDSGPITSGQAHRMLDGIEEGTQRVQVQGRSEDKPW